MIKGIDSKKTTAKTLTREKSNCSALFLKVRLTDKNKVAMKIRSKTNEVAIVYAGKRKKETNIVLSRYFVSFLIKKRNENPAKKGKRA